MLEMLGWIVAVTVGIAAFMICRQIIGQREDAEEARDCALSQLTEAQETLVEVQATAARRLRVARDDAKHAVKTLAMALLPVEDALERAAKAECDLVDYRKGVLLVQRQLESALVGGGLTPVLPQEGDSFDPRTQSCVAEIPGDTEGELVITSLERCGWRLHERLLRHAEVVVTRRGEALALISEGPDVDTPEAEGAIVEILAEPVPAELVPAQVEES